MLDVPLRRLVLVVAGRWRLARALLRDAKAVVVGVRTATIGRVGRGLARARDRQQQTRKGREVRRFHGHRERPAVYQLCFVIPRAWTGLCFCAAQDREPHPPDASLAAEGWRHETP